ncbi:MAG: type III-A CRISPR-associated RAMP protein Csm3 [Planctomycetota bacterium]
MAQHQLMEIRRITGRIKVVTGLRIGAGADSIEIAGNDNPILRNPATAEPFIPGSSIRGRMRSLAEWYFNEVPPGGDVVKAKSDSRVARVFGVSASKDKQTGPTRLIVRDAPLSEDDRDRFLNGDPITEIKSENSINRLTADAVPRPMERVLAGVQFNCEFVYRIMGRETDPADAPGKQDRDLFDNVFLHALALLELDALGGGASRGNGKIKFRDLKMNGEPLELPTIAFPAEVAS